MGLNINKVSIPKIEDINNYVAGVPDMVTQKMEELKNFGFDVFKEGEKATINAMYDASTDPLKFLRNCGATCITSFDAYCEGVVRFAEDTVVGLVDLATTEAPFVYLTEMVLDEASTQILSFTLGINTEEAKDFRDKFFETMKNESGLTELEENISNFSFTDWLHDIRTNSDFWKNNIESNSYVKSDSKISQAESAVGYAEAFVASLFIGVGEASAASKAANVATKGSKAISTATKTTNVATKGSKAISTATKTTEKLANSGAKTVTKMHVETKYPTFHDGYLITPKGEYISTPSLQKLGNEVKNIENTYSSAVNDFNRYVNSLPQKANVLPQGECGLLSSTVVDLEKATPAQIQKYKNLQNRLDSVGNQLMEKKDILNNTTRELKQKYAENIEHFYEERPLINLSTGEIIK